MFCRRIWDDDLSTSLDEVFSRKLDLSSSSLSLLHHFNKSHEADDDARLTLPHQLYKAGDFKQALEHSNLVYQRNPFRIDNFLNLLIIGANYYQLQNYDMCIARNDKALRIQPQFA